MPVEYDYYVKTGQGWLLGGGSVQVVEIWKIKKSSRGNGSKVTSIVGDDLSSLLEDVAALLRQHGDLEGVVEATNRAREESRR